MCHEDSGSTAGLTAAESSRKKEHSLPLEASLPLSSDTLGSRERQKHTMSKLRMMHDDVQQNCLNVQPLSFKFFSQPLNMDSMEKAVDFVASHPRASSSGGVGLIGVSKGMEVVLSMAAFLPEGKVSRHYFLLLGNQVIVV